MCVFYTYTKSQNGSCTSQDFVSQPLILEGEARGGPGLSFSLSLLLPVFLLLSFPSSLRELVDEEMSNGERKKDLAKVVFSPSFVCLFASFSHSLILPLSSSYVFVFLHLFLTITLHAPNKSKASPRRILCCCCCCFPLTCASRGSLFREWVNAEEFDGAASEQATYNESLWPGAFSPANRCSASTCCSQHLNCG